MRTPRRLLAGLLAAALLAQPLALPLSVAASVIEPGEMLSDPELEARARELFGELRCVVCQNQALDESNAELAADMRNIIREQIAAGESDAAIRDYFVARYGDYVLLDPPVKPTTYILWYGPPVIGLLGVLALAVYFRRLRATAAEGPPPSGLSDAERARLDRLLDDGQDDESGAGR